MSKPVIDRDLHRTVTYTAYFVKAGLLHPWFLHNSLLRIISDSEKFQILHWLSSALNYCISVNNVSHKFSRLCGLSFIGNAFPIS